jgi:enoyl-CoA hydratase/carnithine racemase
MHTEEEGHTESDSMWHELQEIIQCVSMSGGIRAIVLASTFDKYFTAGLDCKSK